SRAPKASSAAASCGKCSRAAKTALPRMRGRTLHLSHEGCDPQTPHPRFAHLLPASRGEGSRRTLSGSAPRPAKRGEGGRRPGEGRMKPGDPNAPLLDASNVTIRFGGLTAVDNFNLQIRPHELVGLIGP